MSYHEKKEFKCNLDNCGKRFKHKDSLLRHQVKDHKHLEGNVASNVYVCEVENCFKSF